MPTATTGTYTNTYYYTPTTYTPTTYTQITSPYIDGISVPVNDYVAREEMEKYIHRIYKIITTYTKLDIDEQEFFNLLRSDELDRET